MTIAEPQAGQLNGLFGLMLVASNGELQAGQFSRLSFINLNYPMNEADVLFP